MKLWPPIILSVLFAAAMVPASAAPVAPLCFGRVRTASPVVALTFDCCQTRKPAGYDAKLVSILASNHVPATFFLGGRWIEAHPDAVRYLRSFPFFELENHSYLHPHPTKISSAALRQDLAQAQAALQRATGHAARFLRPPYGEWNDRAVADAAALGMQTVTWSLETSDPDPHETAADIVAAVRRATPGSIIIMHANGRGWHSAEALPRVLQVLKEKGLKPVTLRTLVALGKAQPLPSRP
jgi:peptidoglycan-N-acetylglucosamine deacetylase